ncbi:hypothetical protein BC332_16886 [Capsicum chinense]|nr:hypothetical protein BC332_16886 [Capsicum chinense]
MEPWKDLTGKVVMVTGASSGIGLEFCLDLAKAGCRIIAAARRIDRLKTLCSQINNSEGPAWRAVAVQLDITADGATIEAAVQVAWDAFGRIDALVNNAGLRDPALTSLVRYLIHDSTEYVSGNVFIVDAGTTLASVPIFSSL